MANRIKKGDSPTSTGSVHKDKQLPDDLLRFSFRHFQTTAKWCLPGSDEKPNYTEKLLERLRDVSSLSVSEFRTARNRVLRAHLHVWEGTTEPNGYAHLSEQLRQCEPWQFALSVNEHGRIHGILIDEVFYVVWLDHDHKMYE